MEVIEIINRIKKLKQGIHFENSVKEMDYTIHKFFDFVINSKYLINDKMMIKVDKGNRIISVFIDLADYVNNNSKIWTQEYKVYFDLELSASSEDYFLKFSIDRKTKPKKIFVKEYNIIETMDEIRNENKLQKLS